jgi:DNA polymerase III subunit chi
MTVQFYHLTASPLEQALPKLLEKGLAAGYRALLLAPTPERVEQLSQWLWVYDPASFLPHGTVSEPQAQQQPVLLSTEAAPVNDARLWVVTDGRLVQDAPDGVRVLDMFDGSNDAATAAARERWTYYKNAGSDISYFRQNERGGWEKKA